MNMKEQKKIENYLGVRLETLINDAQWQIELLVENFLCDDVTVDDRLEVVELIIWVQTEISYIVSQIGTWNTNRLLRKVKAAQLQGNTKALGRGLGSLFTDD